MPALDPSASTLGSLALLALGLMALAALGRRGFFQLPSPSLALQRERIRGFTVFLVMAALLAVIFLVHALAGALEPLLHRYAPGDGLLALKMGATATLQLLVLALVTRLQGLELFALRAARHIRGHVRLAAVSYLLSLPLLFLFHTATRLLLQSKGLDMEAQQLIASYLGRMRSEPWALTLLLATLTLLVPWVEEWLFRGFIHTYLRKHLSFTPAVILSSSFFAFVHIEKSMGWHNVPLCLNLFTLALLLGWLYEKRQTLLAPLALHMMVNALASAWILINSS